MPNTWYHSGSDYKPMKEKKEYKVISAEFKDSYHTHGSSFEYYWDFILELDDGSQKKVELFSWYFYKDINVGDIIISNGTSFEIKSIL